MCVRNVQDDASLRRDIFGNWRQEKQMLIESLFYAIKLIFANSYFFIEYTSLDSSNNYALSFMQFTNHNWINIIIKVLMLCDCVGLLIYDKIRIRVDNNL